MAAVGEIIVTMRVDQFVRQLDDSTLMSADDVAALIDSLPAEKKPQDGEQLAKELVRQKKLTAYQAQQIYAGKGRSLVLGNYVILDSRQMRTSGRDLYWEGRLDPQQEFDDAREGQGGRRGVDVTAELKLTATDCP